ncbi:MAG TPA: LysR family transcriptional regulator [Chthoniobacteraceae bacterium]|jgi:DNA-binding transcriptional LysR family regulator|nr:LysR family transcriptional regulator [Chthoniobacteraceae bacterium]
MYIDTFKVFSDLAETGSFSKAAALNEITQSAVSQQIRALETRYKVTLVERGRRSLELTPEGLVFLSASKEILNVYNHLGDRLHELRDVVAGELRLASIYSIGLHELPPVLKRYRQQHADVEVHVEYRRSTQVYAEVVAGEVDLGLVAYPTRRSGLQIDIFSQDDLVLICHPSHPLAKRKSIDLIHLNGEKLISFEPDLPTRKVIDRHLRDHNVQIEHAMEFDNIETVKRAVEIESGVSIVPQHTVRQEVESGVLAAVKIESPKMVRPLGVIARRGRPRSPAHKAFLAALGINPAAVVPEAGEGLETGE